MTASILEGLRAAARNPKLLLLIWVWYALLALVPVIPTWAWWNAVLGYSPEAASVLRRFDLGVFLDLTRREGSGGLGLLIAVAAVAGFVALVSSAFAFGGVLEVLGSEGDRRALMRRFFRGGGHFFWRFVRLALMAVVCLVIAGSAISALMGAITSPARNSESEPAGFLGGLASILAFVGVAGFFLLALDYARIRVARDDSRGMLRAYASALGFVARRVLRVYGIAAAMLVGAAVLVAGYVAYETKAPAAGTWGAIALLAAVQQIAVFGRVFFRVALVAAERRFFMTVVPAPALVEAPAFAGQPATLASPPATPEEGPIPAQ